MLILIGSRALALRAPQLLGRKPVDFDFIASVDASERWIAQNRHKLGRIERDERIGRKRVLSGETNVEFELILDSTSSAAEFAHTVMSDPATIETPFGLVPSIELLFLLKTSHRHLKDSPHFWKSFFDWHALRLAGVTIRDEYQALLKLREKETYTYAHPKLNVSKESFFDGDQVPYVHDHDDIHRAVMLHDRPAYEFFKKDGAQVAVDRKKFEALPFEVQIASPIEEASVLAIERSLVPFPGKWTPKQAWHFALSKVLSSITSGWWRRWAYENGLEVLKRYPEGYFERFECAVAEGRVRPYHGAMMGAA